jgi:uncharacterized protein YodC (DUF2158 family)
MRWRVMMVLASAALAGSVLATDAQAHGGGGHGGGGGVGHRGGFGGAHIGPRVGGFGGARVGGIGGHYMAGIPRGAVRYAPVAGFGSGIGNRTGNRAGILRGRFSVLSAFAFAQTATPNASTGAYATPPANGVVQNPPVGGSSSQTDSGPGFTLVGRDGVSTPRAGVATASSASATSSTENQAVPAFRSGNLVRLRSGGPLMTVKGIKGDQVDCFWTDGNGQINADSFPVAVLQLG